MKNYRDSEMAWRFRSCWYYHGTYLNKCFTLAFFFDRNVYKSTSLIKTGHAFSFFRNFIFFLQYSVKINEHCCSCFFYPAKVSITTRFKPVVCDEWTHGEKPSLARTFINFYMHLHITLRVSKSMLYYIVTYLRHIQ